MALTTSNRAYVGKGKWFIAPKAAGVQSGPLLRVGNVSAASFAISEDKIEVKDYENVGGGLAVSQARISKVEGSLTVYDYSPDNLALSIRGTKTAVTAGAVAAEAHSDVFAGSFVPFSFIPDPSVAPVVTKLPSTVLVANTDYTVFPTGIQLIAGGAVIDGDDLTFGYTKNKANLIQALVSSSAEYLLYFEGLNELDGGNPVPLWVHRVKFSPASGLGLISDDPGTLELKFDVLKEPLITTPGISQYFSLGMVVN